MKIKSSEGMELSTRVINLGSSLVDLVYCGPHSHFLSCYEENPWGGLLRKQEKKLQNVCVYMLAKSPFRVCLAVLWSNEELKFLRGGGDRGWCVMCEGGPHTRTTRSGENPPFAAGHMPLANEAPLITCPSSPFALCLFTSMLAFFIFFLSLYGRLMTQRPPR